MENDNTAAGKFQDMAIAPMHTAEHLLNRTMVNKFKCERSNNAHVERKKSKIAYILPFCPTEKDIEEIVTTMNNMISADLPVTSEICDINKLPEDISTERLPKNAMLNPTIRLVYIGDYDVCPCIGCHVTHTKVLGRFILLGTNWDEERHLFRIRFKLDLHKEEHE